MTECSVTLYAQALLSGPELPNWLYLYFHYSDLPASICLLLSLTLSQLSNMPTPGYPVDPLKPAAIKRGVFISPGTGWVASPVWVYTPDSLQVPKNDSAEALDYRASGAPPRQGDSQKDGKGAHHPNGLIAG